MRGFILAIAVVCSGLFGCGANAPAVKHAEYECLESAKASLEAKIDAALKDPVGVAIEVTAEEAACAVEALDAKGSGSAVPALKLVVQK